MHGPGVKLWGRVGAWAWWVHGPGVGCWWGAGLIEAGSGPGQPARLADGCHLQMDVHYSSGIPNRAFWLMTRGFSCPGGWSMY